MPGDAFSAFISRSPMMERIRKLREANTYPFQKEMMADGANHIRIDGRRYLNISSGSYLGLERRSDVQVAAEAALDKYGPGAGARFLNGSRAIHAELEDALARFLRKEAAVVFSTAMPPISAAFPL